MNVHLRTYLDYSLWQMALTPKRLLFCMYSHVVHKMLLLSELHAANLTPRRLLFRIYYHLLH